MLGVEDMVLGQLGGEDGMLGLSTALAGRPESLSRHLSLGGLVSFREDTQLAAVLSFAIGLAMHLSRRDDTYM